MKATISKIIALSFCATLIAGCGSSNNAGTTPPPPPPPPPVQDITIVGSIFDGPVSGGTLFIFAAADVNTAIAAAADAQDRAAELSAAGPLATLDRDPAGDETFSLTIGDDLAGSALFLVFDAEGSTDAGFGGAPFNLEAVVIAGNAGDTMRVNLTPHTTAIAIGVRALLDPDGDGTPIDAAAIGNEIGTAVSNVGSVFGTSAVGDDLFPGGVDPLTTDDIEVLSDASLDLGLAVRTAAAMADISMDEAMFLLAADAADGMLDGDAPVQFSLDTEQEEAIAAVADAHALGRELPGDVAALSCASSATSLRRACGFEVLDEFFLGLAICAHEGDSADAESCRADVAEERDEALEECAAVTEARHQLCVATGDAVHDPAFGPAYASNFVDPREIGSTVASNPYLPLVQGTEWVYEGTFEEDGESITEVITITVTGRTKLIDGIRCVVVRDVVTVDDELVEDTDDWFAQDVDGNIWYCGEEAKDYEWFDGDDPAVPELIAIDGSFKAGREGDEAGILLPGTPVVGDIFRQEVSFANAEDVIEILATDGTETVPAAACAGDCLVTRDFSPLDPGVEENKYYAPGIGKILEIDLETGDRFELVSVSVTP